VLDTSGRSGVLMRFVGPVGGLMRMVVDALSSRQATPARRLLQGASIRIETLECVAMSRVPAAMDRSPGLVMRNAGYFQKKEQRKSNKYMKSQTIEALTIDDCQVLRNRSTGGNTGRHLAAPPGVLWELTAVNFDAARGGQAAIQCRRRGACPTRFRAS
jgi:hypothetical protein